MKRTFEFFITLIIFYGVYAAFDSIAPMLWDSPSQFWIIVTALIVASLILALYALVVRKSVSQAYQQRTDELHSELDATRKELAEAFKIKHDVEVAAEASIEKEEHKQEQ